MSAARQPLPVGLVTYSVKPRGGAVHTVALAEALHEAGYPVRVIALGDPAVGFFRPVKAPVTIIPAPPHLPTLEERVFASVSALAAGLAGLAADYPVLHTQDCISARAACQIRDAARQAPAAAQQAPAAAQQARAAASVVVRTVHHVDDFTSPSLIECQRQAILEPDRILVVSEHWRHLLGREYGTAAEVVHNGVDIARFQAADPSTAAGLRQRASAGATDRPLILSVGGIEPRKGSDTLVRALAILKRAGRRPVLAVVGGHSFQDYRVYRDTVLASLPDLDLRLDDDVVMLGTVPDAELPAWYKAADVLAFPSTKEGWGLAVLEAMSAGLPVVASDLPVFREYMTDRRDALLVGVGDPPALAKALAEVLDDPDLAAGLRSAALALCERFSWARSAAEHQAIYASLHSSAPAPASDPGDHPPASSSNGTPASASRPGSTVLPLRTKAWMASFTSQMFTFIPASTRPPASRAASASWMFGVIPT
ncbi:MAG: MSMEG_0565 family glycosyltransferase [Streptosporangiaceae bacterium]